MQHKTALITGSTDGIGFAVALELTKDGYAVHLHGRSRERGEEALGKLKASAPGAPHELWLADLASVQASRDLLKRYRDTHQALGLLFLNANTHIRPTPLTEDRIEQTFAIGCVSRYLFSIELNPLLSATPGARVSHIGDARFIRPIDYTSIRKGSRGITSATMQSYVGDALLAYFFNWLDLTPVAHEIISPGSVNTKQLRDQPAHIRFLAWLMRPQETQRRCHPDRLPRPRNHCRPGKGRLLQNRPRSQTHQQTPHQRPRRV